MSIVVDLDQLAETLAEYPYGYLLTSRDGAVKAVTISATVLDGAVLIPTESRGSAANLDANSVATLLFPPTQHHGHSLIIDGTAATSDEGGFRLTPTKAVLHRPAEHNDTDFGDGEVPHQHDSACGHDCRPVG
ncbi:MAG: pyridoxamine 5'-phosphate oxidase family protein [Actinomycetia bacterium]|nr:pyridoxamine 5'-phosphate oxidase family protein [Actinomycetes bacterium]